MIRRISIALLWLVVTVTAILSLTNVQIARVYAQSIEEHFTLSVYPATGFVTVKPGSEVIHTIVLRNKSTRAITVKPRLVDFAADGSTGTPVLQDSSMFPYLVNSESVLTPVTIAPTEQASIPFVIKPPETAPLKEYHLTVLFENQPSSTSTDASALVPTVGSNVVVLVSGEPPNSFLKILSLQRSKFIDSFRPLTFVPLGENQGSAATIASGSAVIKNWRGRTVATFPLYPDVVLAQSTREIRAAQPAAPILPDDPAAAIATQLEPIPFFYRQPFLFGPYVVEFNLMKTNDEGTTTSVQSFTLFALPFSAFLVILVTALIVFGLRKWQRNKSSPSVIS